MAKRRNAHRERAERLHDARIAARTRVEPLVPVPLDGAHGLLGCLFYKEGSRRRRFPPGKKRRENLVFQPLALVAHDDLPVQKHVPLLVHLDREVAERRPVADEHVEVWRAAREQIRKIARSCRVRGAVRLDARSGFERSVSAQYKSASTLNTITSAVSTQPEDQLA